MTRLSAYARRLPSSAIGQVMQEAAALVALGLFVWCIMIYGPVVYAAVNGG
jgi:hypothetical protein